MELTALALWLNTTFASFDESVALAIHKLFLSAGGFFTPFMNFVSFLGMGGVILILTSFVLIFFPKTRRYGTTMLIALAVGVLITNLIFKPLAARPRPYTWDGSVFQQIWQALGCHTESDKSFPSGHVTAAMAVATSVFLLGNKKISWTAFLFAIAMCVSRIYLGVHYPTDTIAGLITGAIGGVAAYFIAPRIPEGYYEADFIVVAHDLRRSLKKGKHQK